MNTFVKAKGCSVCTVKLVFAHAAGDCTDTFTPLVNRTILETNRGQAGDASSADCAAVCAAVCSSGAIIAERSHV